MKNVYQKMHALGVSVAISLGLAAPAMSQVPIKIGAVLSVTGGASFLGDPEQKTLQHFVDKINSGGGVLGRKLALVIYDDGTDTNKANSFTKRLIEVDQVDLIIGSSTTGATMAMVPLVEKAGIPLISLAGSAVITEPTKKWVFKTPGSDTHSIEKTFEDMRLRKLTRLAIMAESSGSGQSTKAEAQKLSAQYGIKIVANEAFGAKDTDSTPQLVRLKDNSEVDVILVGGFGQGPAMVTRNFAQINGKKPLYFSHGVASQEFITLAGKASDGVRLSAPAQLVAAELPNSDRQKPILEAYRKEYALRWKEDPSTFGGYSYDALMIAVAAIKRAGSTNKEAVRDAIEKTRNYIGTAGVVNMSATDHTGLDISSFRLLEVKDGRFTLVR